ncbi:uncharacterized protein [Branchiostoma lanceolatum]|uniref:uncharacterized protein n=1 Tax=Branchiostoma lanceolatum TaxID=7740 RepID=UPI0034546001
MKREGGSVPWTAPQQCKRSRLCISTVGSQDSRLHLVLHFRGTSSSLVRSKPAPRNLKKISLTRPVLKHQRKSCIDKKINGKIFKTQGVESKDKTADGTKIKLTQKKFSPLALSTHVKTGLENGKMPCTDKMVNGVVSKASTEMKKEETTSHTKEPPTQQTSGQYLEMNCPSSDKSHRLGELQNTSTLDSNSPTHCKQTENVKGNCREISRPELRNSKDSGMCTVKYSGYRSLEHFTPLSKTRTLTKPGAKRTPRPNSCHKVMHHNSDHSSGPLEEKGAFAVKNEQKPLLQKSHAGVETAVEDSRHSKWYVSPVSGTWKKGRHVETPEENSCSQRVKLSAKANCKTKARRRSKEPSRKERCYRSDEEGLTDSQEWLFPTCPWEEEEDADPDVAAKKVNPSPDSNETKEDEAVSANNKLCAKRSPEQIQTLGYLKVNGHKVEEAVTVDATRQDATAETGRIKKKNSPKKGPKKSGGKSPKRVGMNGASVHGQQMLQKDRCNEENIVETLQNKLVIAKHCDNTEDSNGPIKSADTADIIDVVIRPKEPIKEDFANRSGGSVHNGPTTVKNDCSEEMPLSRAKDVGPDHGRMKQAAATASSPRKLDLEVADLVTLAPQGWLNDNVLNGYFELLAEGRPDDLYCFNTFFYTQLCRKGYQGVKRWTKKVQIFQKALLLVPLHLGNHWCLAEVAVQDKLLYLYDSQGGDNLTCLQRLVGYLCCEAQERGEENFTWGWDGHCREDIPVQETSSDCGVYVCQLIPNGQPV